MARVRVEFMVEPFAEGAPGPHVLAAIDAAGSAGEPPQIGPFGTSVEVESGSAGALLDRVISAALAEGASRVSIQVERLDGKAT